LKPIVVVPFASEVHGKEYYANVLEVFRKHFGRYGIEFHGDVVTSVEEAERLGGKYQGFVPIALVLTGGTSSLVYRFVSGGSIDKVFILAHSEHNSMASAVSARTKIERDGFSAGLYWCDEYYSIDCENVVDKLMLVARTVAFVDGSRIAVAADREKGDVEEAFESRFNATVDIVSLSKVASMMDSASSEAVSEISKEIESKFDFEVSKQALDRVARLYIALEKIAKEGKYDVVSIDCFPFIIKHGITPCIPLSLLNSKGVIAVCEADLTAVFGMMLAKVLSGRSGWIGNTVSFKSKNAMFSHCTIALDIAYEKPRALQHFETGAPYAVTASMQNTVATIVSVDRDFTIVAVDRGRIVKSGLLTYSTCRTQTIIEFDFPVDNIPRYAPSNHHIVILGDFVDIIKDVSYMFNMDAVTYREVAMW